MTILKKGNFRINTISVLKSLTKKGGDGVDLNFEPLEIADGLSIDKHCPDGEAYYSICLVKYNKHEEAAEMSDDCCGRLLDIENEEWPLFKELYELTLKLVEVANMEED